MIETIMIGNIGQDARVIRNNGSEFISFSVAHTDRYKDRGTGQVVEDTTWVSVTQDGNGGNLLPYLTKGKVVCLRGRIRARPNNEGNGVWYNMYNPRIDLVGGSSNTNAGDARQSTDDEPF